MEEKFDPHTGEPLIRETVERKPTGYDPQTGEPVYDSHDGQDDHDQIRFDPMTGQPLSTAGYAGNTGSTGNTGSETQNAGLKAAKIVPFIVGAAVIALIVFICIWNNPKLKISRAVAATFKENRLISALDCSRVIKSGNYTMAVDGTIYGADVNAEYMRNMSKKKQSLSGTASYGGQEVNVDALLNSKELIVSAPDIIDEAIIYNYTEDKDGYLGTMLKNANLSFDKLDSSLAQLNSSKSTDEMYARLKKVITGKVSKLKLEKADKEEIKVNGKRRKCGGYTVDLTGEFMSDLLDSCADIIADYDDGVSEVYDAAEDSSVDLSDEVAAAAKEMDDLEDIYVTVYLYHGQMAGIYLECKEYNTKAELQFNGGATPTENMNLKYSTAYYSTQIEKTGSTENGVERAKWTADSNEFLSRRYEYKTGDLSVEAHYVPYVDSVSFKGNLKKKGKNRILTLRNVNVGGNDMKVDAAVSVSAGSKIESIKADDTIDIGNASQSELLDIGNEASTKIGRLQSLFYDEYEDAAPASDYDYEDAPAASSAAPAASDDSDYDTY